MKTLKITALLLLLTSPFCPAHGDWWSDNGDTANVEDIDSGAQPETNTDDDLMKNSVGPGQPQNPPPQAPIVYDGRGYGYAYGMPYGYGPGFGYGYGYISGPIVGKDSHER